MVGPDWRWLKFVGFDEAVVMCWAEWVVQVSSICTRRSRWYILMARVLHWRQFILAFLIIKCTSTSWEYAESEFLLWHQFRLRFSNDRYFRSFNNLWHFRIYSEWFHGFDGIFGLIQALSRLHCGEALWQVVSFLIPCHFEGISERCLSLWNSVTSHEHLVFVCLHLGNVVPLFIVWAWKDWTEGVSRWISTTTCMLLSDSNVRVEWNQWWSEAFKKSTVNIFFIASTRLTWWLVANILWCCLTYILRWRRLLWDYARSGPVFSTVDNSLDDTWVLGCLCWCECIQSRKRFLHWRVSVVWTSIMLDWLLVRIVRVIVTFESDVCRHGRLVWFHCACNWWWHAGLSQYHYITWYRSCALSVQVLIERLFLHPLRHFWWCSANVSNWMFLDGVNILNSSLDCIDRFIHTFVVGKRGIELLTIAYWESLLLLGSKTFLYMSKIVILIDQLLLLIQEW